MKPLRWLRAAVLELVSLIVDDAVTFAGGVAGLLAAYLLAHHVHGTREWAGFVLYGIVWLGLVWSFRRHWSRGRR